MQQHDTGHSSRRWAVLAAVACASPACAQGAGAKPGGPLAALALLFVALPVVATAITFIVAALFPTFTRRAERAVRVRLGASLGWGLPLAVLAGIVAGIFTKGGQPGQAVAGVVAGIALLTGLVGLVGIAKVIGDWSLRRWGIASLGPLSVLLGAPLWGLGAAIPIFGYVAGFLTLIASIGVTACVVLAPHTFDEPSGKAEAPPPLGDPLPWDDGPLGQADVLATDPGSIPDTSLTNEETASPSDF